MQLRATNALLSKLQRHGGPKSAIVALPASLGQAIRQARGPSLHMQDEIVAELANQTAVRFGDAKPLAPRTDAIVPLVVKTATVGRAAMVALAAGRAAATSP